MKKIVIVCTVFIFGFSAFPKNENPIDCSVTDKGVVISGVRWATRNVDAPGTFVQNSEDIGGHFTWYEAQNACPRGWRVPTEEEFLSLFWAGNERTTTRNGVSGRFFGTASYQIFFPAAGFRDSDGVVHYVDTEALYWSSTQYKAGNARSLFFRVGIVVPRNLFCRQSGLSVRCVAE